ncbi:hypothetical protein KSP40_PGU001887 [Platanthera guangdongensis]|uniref:Uncharacterized protein n=1 Tax=Platanthera guangdongensis TaxID=2320717 RepID=A0ABR2MQ89_9ASPA
MLGEGMRVECIIAIEFAICAAGILGIALILETRSLRSQNPLSDINIGLVQENLESLLCSFLPFLSHFFQISYRLPQLLVTGTGFIKMEISHDSCFNLAAESTASLGHVSLHGNPATNDWIPSADLVLPVSHVPKRRGL